MDDYEKFFRKYYEFDYRLKNKNHPFYYLYKFFGWIITTPVMVFRFLWYIIWKPMDYRARKYIPHKDYKTTMIRMRLFQAFIILCFIFSVIVIIIVAIYMFIRINFSPI